MEQNQKTDKDVNQKVAGEKNQKDKIRKNKMTKETIPEGFTVPMALVDLLPVVFFGGTEIVTGIKLGSIPVMICAALVFLSGFVKVLWKMIAAVKKKNIWPMFVQMRIIMPAAFVLMVVFIAIALRHFEDKTVLAAVFGMPQLILFIIGILGIAGMVFCAARLDSSDPKSNWIEQGINSVAQLFIFLGTLFM